MRATRMTLVFLGLLALLAGCKAFQCPGAYPDAAAAGIKNASFEFSNPPCNNDSSVGSFCSAVCDAGLTGSVQAYCKAGTSSANWDYPITNTGCRPYCPGAPPVIAGVTWDVVGTIRVPTENISTTPCTGDILDDQFCTGNCSAGQIGSPRVYCVLNSTTGLYKYQAVGQCYDAGTQICLGAPAPSNSTIWPLTCRDVPLGQNCTGTCRMDRGQNWYGTGRLSQPATIQCQADGAASTGGSWNSTPIAGQCVNVCGRSVVYLQNVDWNRTQCFPEGWAPLGGGPFGQPEQPAFLTGIGGLEAGQKCYGTCRNGLVGTPQMTCNPKGYYFIEARGTCRDPALGACFGAPAVQAPVDAAPWSAACYDMAAGTNCTSMCNRGTLNGGAVGYATGDAPYQPYVPCVFNASNPPSNGNYGQAQGKCEKVCIGQLPTIPNGAFPSSCLPDPVTRIGGLNTTSGVCVATCNATFTGTVTMACTGTGWGPVVGACVANNAQGVCLGPPPASNPINTLAWNNAACTNLLGGVNCQTTCKGPQSATVAYGTINQNFQPYMPCLTTGPSSAAWGAPVGRCWSVCNGQPPQLNNGSWPADCTPNAVTRIGGRSNTAAPPFNLELTTCRGTCDTGYAGSPFVTCFGSTGWSLISGGCQPIAGGVCVGQPTVTVANALAWTCQDYVVGTNCTGTCKAGYGSASAPTTPTVQCVSSGGPSKGSWAGTVTGQCVKVCPAPPPTPNVAWDPTCTPTGPGVGGRALNQDCVGTCNGLKPVITCITLPNGKLGWTHHSGC